MRRCGVRSMPSSQEHPAGLVCRGSWAAAVVGETAPDDEPKPRAAVTGDLLRLWHEAGGRPVLELSPISWNGFGAEEPPVVAAALPLAARPRGRGRCPHPPSCRISPYRAVGGCFPSSR